MIDLIFVLVDLIIDFLLFSRDCEQDQFDSGNEEQLLSENFEIIREFPAWKTSQTIQWP